MSIRKSLFFSFLDRYSGLMINILSSMVIARLLTPAEIGVFSITMVLLTFAAAVRDMGAGQYMVLEKNLTVEKIRSVWAIQLGLGLALALIVVVASYPVAAFYNEPRMHDIMLVVALNYITNPFGSLTHAWLMREMRFESSALIRVSSTLVGALVSTGLAWKNFGPISLAFGALANTMVTALISVYFRPKHFPWLPGFSEVRQVLKFGSQLTASSIVNTVSNMAPELLLGKLQGLTAVGLFSRANGLVQMFNRLFVDAVGAVCSPWFAKKAREHGSLAPTFLKATAYVTALGWSFCLMIVFLAYPITRVLYGTQWDASVDLARLLAIAVAFIVPTSLCQAALLPSAGVTVIARLTALNALQTVAWVAFGSWSGLMTLGATLIAAAAINAALWLHSTAHHIGMGWANLIRTLINSAGVAAMAALGPAAAMWFYGPYPIQLFPPLLLGVVGMAIGFFAGLQILNHPLRTELSGLILDLRQRLFN